MKAIRKQVDKIKPNFEKGGKLFFLRSTFDAFETFLFVPNHVTKKGAHIRDSIDSKRTMIIVVLALLPAMFFGCWNIGYQHDIATGISGDIFSRFWLGFGKFFPILVVSYAVALGIEFAFAQFRGHEVNEGVLVTGFLIPLVMPPHIPLWMVALATAFAIIFGKEVFGGTGMNIYNPALLARAFVFFSYPTKISGVEPWVYLGDKVPLDGFSAATPLGNAGTGEFDKLASFWDGFIGTIPGSIGETSFVAIMLGAFILLVTGVGSWRIILSVFAGGALMAWIFNLIGANEYMTSVSPIMHLVFGGFAFGAVFMATDPVSASQTNTGKYIYGFLIGAFTILIRVVNPAYPEGMMLAILLMNTFAPLIDYYVVEANIKRRMKRIKLVKTEN